MCARLQVAPAFENIFMFHNTWFSYQASMRIFKHYHLNVEDTATGATSMSFSSYPGISFTFFLAIRVGAIIL